MGIFSNMFNSDTIDKTVDAVISTGDKLWYTPEEKADMKLKTANVHIGMLKAYEPFKLAQRLLALSVILPYMLAWLVVFSLGFINVDLTSQYSLLQGDVGTGFLLILGFYFAGGLGEGLIRAKKGK